MTQQRARIVVAMLFLDAGQPVAHLAQVLLGEDGSDQNLLTSGGDGHIAGGNDGVAFGRLGEITVAAHDRDNLRFVFECDF